MVTCHPLLLIQTHKTKSLYLLSLKLVRSDNVSNRNHLVLVDWIKILRNVLWNDNIVWSQVNITKTEDDIP